MKTIQKPSIRIPIAPPKKVHMPKKGKGTYIRKPKHKGAKIEEPTSDT